VSEDGALVARYLRSRREDDFAELYRRCAPALWRLALRLAGGRTADADDLVGETWLRAVRGLESFRRDARLGPWLAGIAWNCWRERRRRSWRETALEEPLDTIAVEPRRHAETLDLRAALDALPEGYRAVLILHDLEGYTHAEIGEALGVSAGTSKSQLSRGRAVLRRLLGDAAGTRASSREGVARP
jgi:RNA polymerase sigma-70 factor (ECF subfamily)